jgi:hypothetical protein
MRARYMTLETIAPLSEDLILKLERWELNQTG